MGERAFLDFELELLSLTRHVARRCHSITRGAGVARLSTSYVPERAGDLPPIPAPDPSPLGSAFLFFRGGMAISDAVVSAATITDISSRHPGNGNSQIQRLKIAQKNCLPESLRCSNFHRILQPQTQGSSIGLPYLSIMTILTHSETARRRGPPEGAS